MSEFGTCDHVLTRLRHSPNKAKALDNNQSSSRLQASLFNVFNLKLAQVTSNSQQNLTASSDLVYDI